MHYRVTLCCVGIYFQFVMVMCFVSLMMTILIVHLHSRAIADPLSPMPPRVSLIFIQLYMIQHICNKR